jgi:hypothetical protein
MRKSAKEKIVIYGLDRRHPGLTPNVGGSFTEAASVCLNRHHDSPVTINVTCDARQSDRIVDFKKPDIKTLRSWNNDIDTTESGACGVAIAAVEAEERLVAVSRAETQTGADWYVAPKGVVLEDLEDCFRLEISGLDAGTKSDISTRLQQKIKQTQRGNSNLPAIASVVGFKEQTVLIKKVGVKK